MLWQVSVGTKLQGVPNATVAREAAPLPQRRVRPKDALLALAYPRKGEPFAETRGRVQGRHDHGLNDYQASRSK